MKVFNDISNYIHSMILNSNCMVIEQMMMEDLRMEIRTLSDKDLEKAFYRQAKKCASVVPGRNYDFIMYFLGKVKDELIKGSKPQMIINESGEISKRAWDNIIVKNDEKDNV